jgi:ATP-binding cassette subfamily F protein 3
LLIVSHDRRLLETVCDRLWVVDDGLAAPFAGTYREWRAALSSGWTVAGAVETEAKRLRAGSDRSRVAAAPRSAAGDRGGSATAVAPTPAPARTAARPGRKAKLSKDAYRKQKSAVEADLTRLGLRKNHLELSLGDPTVAANFVEVRRISSELADIEAALAAAEDAWLEVEERAP